VNSPTFPCPFCGAPITGGAAGSAFACPYCQARVVAPGASSGPGPMAGPPAARAPEGPLTAGASESALGFDPRVGFVMVGAHAPYGEPPRLRAWDMGGRRVLWEALGGQSWVADVSASGLRVLGQNVYVAHKRQLLALDLATGARRWGLPLPDAADGSDDAGGGLAVADPFAREGRGAILVRAIDNGLHAFDRDSGQVLWARSFGDKSFELEAIEGAGVCLVRHGFPYVKVDIINPAYAQPIASLGHDHWSTDLGRARPAGGGRTVATVVDDFGSGGDDDGLLVFDAVTGAQHAFDRKDDLEEDIVAIAMGPRVFAAAREGLYVGPRGRVVPSPVPNHTVVSFAAAGPTLALLLRKAHGTPVRRVVGLDPATLAFRFDAGEAGTEPDEPWEGQLASDGWSLVFVSTPTDDRSACELRSVDTTTGRMLWSRPVGTWRSHRFLAGHLVVWSDERIEVLSPSNGQVVAASG
jgi:outer membrane protein assembly factor BamB